MFVGWLAILCSAALFQFAAACPFCSAVKPTLAEQRESAAVAFLGECVAADTKAKPAVYSFAVRKWFKGQPAVAKGENIRVPLVDDVKIGTLAMLLGNGESGAALDKLQCLCVPLSEVGFVYVAQSPDMRTPAVERLAYFAKFLESSDPLVADDAFLEFGRVPYDVAAPAVQKLSAEKLRKWIVDLQVPPERKGFYGLALGLTAQGKDRAENLALLRKLAEADPKAGGDFRAGFDGVLGGYLVAAGPEAIKQIDEKFLAQPHAAIGDVRQAQRALRFYFEFGPAGDRDAVAKAVEHLLDRPSEAALAITDLARWKRWSALARIADLYGRKNYSDAVTSRAIVGYLSACPLPAAAEALTRLRKLDPQGIAKAQQTLETLGGKN